MSITVRGPDGAVITFPDNTPHSVIEREMARHYGQAQEQLRDRRSAAVSLSNPKDKRSLGQRLGDVFSDTWNTNFISEGWRAGLDDTADYIDASQRGDLKGAMAVNDRFTLNPVRLVSRLYNSVGVLTDMTDNTRDTRRAADTAISDERQRRQQFAQASRDDPFWEAEGGIVGKAAHGGAALLGVLGGSAVDPTSYISGGSRIWVKAGVQGLVAGATDLLAQNDATSAGLQDDINLGRTAASVGAGVAFTGLLEGAGSLVRRVRNHEPRPSMVELDQALRDELDLSDSVNLPALSLDDMTFRPPVRGEVSPLPARIEQPRAKGPSLDDLEAKERAAGAEADAKADERWNGVDWGLAGSPERAKAAMAHLDSLKKFVKPEQVDRFVRWLGKQGDEITDGASHWNADVFDFDKLINDPDQFEELANVMGQIFKPLYDAAGDAPKSWKSVQDRQQTFGLTTSDVVKAHADITSEFGVSSKINALETIAAQHVDHLVTKVADVRAKMANGNATATDISDLAAHLQHRLFRALFVPFLRTPINLVRAGMFDRNPVLFGLLGENRAKFMNYTAALRGLDQSLERGGAEADLAMARLVTGMGFMATAGLLFANGDLVGKRSAAEEEDGVKSYSIRLGGRWFQYQQLSPVAEMLGIVADMSRIFKDHDINDDDILQGIGGGVLAAIVNNIVNKAALQGVGDFWDMIDPSFTQGDTDRGERFGKEVMKKVGSSVVPAVVRNFAQTQDPVMREANGLLEHLAANIPTLSQSLPERRDWLGLPVVRTDKDGGLFEGLIQPTRISKNVEDIVRREVSALSSADPELRMAQRPPERFNEQKITKREHALVLEYQGQVYRPPFTGQNMHEALGTLIQSREYALMADAQRAATIKDTVSQYRRLANAAIRNGAVPELREMVNRTGGAKANERAAQEGWNSWQTQANARRYGVTTADMNAIMTFQPGQ